MRKLDDVRSHLSQLNKLVDYIFENASQRFVLKGGTALMRNFNLDRVSENIDLDAVNDGVADTSEIFTLVAQFAAANGLTSYVKKDTATTKRVMLVYDESRDAVKVEVSYRPIEIDEESVDGESYSVSELCLMKCSAASQRTKLRDMYDLAFICVNHYDKLTSTAKRELFEAFRHRGLAEIEASVNTALETDSIDKLIDLARLDGHIYEALTKLGLSDELSQARLDAHEQFIAVARQRWQSRFSGSWLDDTELETLGFDGQAYGVEINSAGSLVDGDKLNLKTTAYDDARALYDECIDDQEISSMPRPLVVKLLWANYVAGRLDSTSVIDNVSLEKGE